MSPQPQSNGLMPDTHAPDVETPKGATRRSFIGYVMAGSTLAVTASVGLDAVAPAKASAAGASPIPSNPLFANFYDFLDTMRDLANPTIPLLKIEMGSDGIAHFAVPRQEVGQGITTSFAQVIGDELDMPFDQVKISLADARPELMGNQLTGGSTSHYSLFLPIKVMAATARTALTQAAADMWGLDAAKLTTRSGAVHGPNGLVASYGSLAEKAATYAGMPLDVKLKTKSSGLIGQSIGRVDARDAVTGAKKYTMDLKVPNALPTMICRPPTIQGTIKSVRNLEQVKAMPGVTDVGVIELKHPTNGKTSQQGVAVRARTFGQCIDAVRALNVEWGAGTKDGENSDSLLKQVAGALLPMVPAMPGSEVIEETYTFQYRSGSPMETNCAIADVRENSAEVWGVFKMPIVTLERIGIMLNMPFQNVKVHCNTGGGSFGRHLFSDAAYEAVAASKLFGKPVKLMWHRADDARHGRMHPASVCNVRATVVGNSVSSFSMRHASSACDWTHGIGEIISGSATAQDPRLGFSGNKEYGNLSVSMGFFQLVTAVPYDFGGTDVMLNEVFNYDDLPTSAVRNVYSPDTTVAREMLVDKIAEKMGLDSYEFRRAFLKEAGMKAAVDKVAELGNWGRNMPAGTAQAIAFHQEYKGYVACLMEIDARPSVSNRKIRDAYTGPRITKAIMAVNVSQVINPRNIQAQIMGGCMDGIAQALTASCHIEDGLPLEASWDNYRYTRQWNAPTQFECIVMPDDRGYPSGVGELGVAVGQAAAAIAYAKATGKNVTEFPVNFREPLGFKVKSKIPSIPQSPTNGRRFAR